MTIAHLPVPPIVKTVASRGRYGLVLASSLLATASSAAAQTQSQPPDAAPSIRLERPRAEQKEEPPPIAIPWWEARAERPGKLHLSDRSIADGMFQRGTSTPAAGFGPTWRMKGGVSYRSAGGLGYMKFIYPGILGMSVLFTSMFSASVA